MKALISPVALMVILFVSALEELKAQYYEKDTTNRNLTAHLIYADINPIIAFGINSDISNPEWLLGYKFQRNSSSRLKIGLGYEHEPQNFERNYWGTIDSLALWSSYNYWSRMGRLYLGMEWGKYDRVISPYYGIDLMVGWLGSKSVSSWELYGLSDRAYYLPDISADTLYLTQNDIRIGYTKIEEYFESNSLHLGVALKVGLRAQMGRHWEGFLEMSPSLQYTNVIRSYNLTTQTEIGLRQRSFFDFRFQLLNFALAYKF